MTTTIAVAGKGGTGKTTLAGLLIRRLAEAQAGPILAIDADPASNLNTVLDLPLERTVGDVREETSEKARANLLEAGISKQGPAGLRDQLEHRGRHQRRPDGDGPTEGLPAATAPPTTCCGLIIDQIADSYPWVVIDNEAGLEHLSRRTTRDVDVLFIVSDATVRGITTAGRVAALLGELETKVGRHYLVVNRAAQGLAPELEAVIAENGLDLLAVLPDDPVVAEFDAAGKALVGLPADSSLSAALEPVVAAALVTPTRG